MSRLTKSSKLEREEVVPSKVVVVVAGGVILLLLLLLEGGRFTATARIVLVVAIKRTASLMVGR